MRQSTEVSVETYARLVHAWGNETYSATPEYLATVAEAVRQTQGPVLECGSGLTSIVIGLEAERRGSDAYALEHDPYWAMRTRRALGRNAIARIRVLDAPLRDHGAFAWYGLPPDLPEYFTLVVCDGPPAYTCGRYGLLPAVGGRIRGDILLDDATRGAEQQVIARWVQEFGVSLTLAGTRKPFARLRLPA